MALAASDWVTTKQELKSAVVAAVVVDATDALVVGPALDDLEEDELQAASTIAAETPTNIPTTPGRSLKRPLDGMGGRCAQRKRIPW
jgi:hypothetical protein